MMKNVLKAIYRKAGRASPFLFHAIQYRRAAARLANISSNVAEVGSPIKLFDEFLGRCEGKRCLQIGVKDNVGRKYGPNWVSVDKFDTREFIDFNYDIHDLNFEDGSFDAAVCWSILEHVPQPMTAISELQRVLKPGGEIWVQLPFLFPYHEAPKDYWRVTPDGLRVWMQEFDEQYCGCDFWDKTSLIAATYFLGSKKI